MTCFACVLVLTVSFTLIVANSTVRDDHNVTSTTESILLQNSTEESLRARPLPSKSTHTTQKPTEVKEEVELLTLLEKNFPPEPKYRETSSVSDFWKRRNALADAEVHKLLGNHLPLNEKEREANKVILAEKIKEYDKTVSTTEVFPPSISFLEAKDLIERTNMYKIIRQMPKGATLYSLLIASVPLDFMYQLTFEDFLYFRFEDHLEIKFSKTRPGPGWRLLSQIRGRDDLGYVDDLNEKIKDSLVLHPNKSSPSFLEVLHTYRSLTSYKPNFLKTFKTALETLYEDKIIYAEIYYDFPEIYDIDGKIYSPVETVKICKALLAEFMRSHKDFVGIRFLYVPIDSLNLQNLKQFREASTALWRVYPDLIAGFGVMIRGETEMPYSSLVEELVKFPKEMKLFLDAGVTNNWGTGADYDVLDALALDSVILGAGVTLTKHPLALKEVRKEKLLVKSGPITTQVLTLVKDLRNHPVTYLVAVDHPVVIVNVAGTAWNATGLSYDLYEAFVAMTPRFCDLRCLKQFVLNSMIYSTLSNDEKKKCIKTWEAQWDEFINDIIDYYV